MTKYIFHVHSFVDLITNSSSELFIATGYKSLEVLKQIVEEITSLPFDLIFDCNPEIVTKENHEYYKKEYECDFPIGTILLDLERDDLRMAIIDNLTEKLNLTQDFSAFSLED